MICDVCGCPTEDCECGNQEDENEAFDEPIDFGDDERVWGYDGDSL